MERLIELLYKKEQYLRENETLIFIKNGEMQVLTNDGLELSMISGNINKKLEEFLEGVKEENE